MTLVYTWKIELLDTHFQFFDLEGQMVEGMLDRKLFKRL